MATLKDLVDKRDRDDEERPLIDPRLKSSAL
jgi:hypothetical protein